MPFMDESSLQGGFAESVKTIAGRLADETFLAEAVRSLQSAAEPIGNTTQLSPKEIADKLTGYAAFMKKGPPMQQEAAILSPIRHTAGDISIMDELAKKQEEVKQRGALQGISQGTLPDVRKRSGRVL